jgi:hypothetical protein
MTKGLAVTDSSVAVVVEQRQRASGDERAPAGTSASTEAVLAIHKMPPVFQEHLNPA